MCKIQPPKPGPTQTTCAPPLRELWVACSATQELPTRLSYAPRTLEQKKQQCWDKKKLCWKCWGKKVCAGHASHTLAHCFQEICQPALLQTDGSTADRQTGKQTHRQARIDGKVPLTSARKPGAFCPAGPKPPEASRFFLCRLLCKAFLICSWFIRKASCNWNTSSDIWEMTAHGDEGSTFLSLNSLNQRNAQNALVPVSAVTHAQKLKTQKTTRTSPELGWVQPQNQ